MQQQLLLSPHHLRALYQMSVFCGAVEEEGFYLQHSCFSSSLALELPVEAPGEIVQLSKDKPPVSIPKAVDLTVPLLRAHILIEALVETGNTLAGLNGFSFNTLMALAPPHEFLGGSAHGFPGFTGDFALALAPHWLAPTDFGQATRSEAPI